MMHKVSSQRKRKLIIIILIFVAILSLLFCAAWAYKKSVVSQLRSAAYQFTPEEAWEKKYEYWVDPEIITCIADNPCPMYAIDWEFTRPISKTALEGKLVQAGWTTPLDGSCEINPRNGGVGSVCKSITRKDEKTIQLIYLRDSSDTNYNSIIIRVYSKDTTI